MDYVIAATNQICYILLNTELEFYENICVKQILFRHIELNCISTVIDSMY